jgi:SH3 domain
VRARTAHQIPDRPPLRLDVGEEVHAGDRDTEWTAFVFVVAQHGAGWVPARYLSQPSGPAIVRTAYDTTELPTQAGEILEVVAEDPDSGWLWCRSGSGREGWVPVKTLEEVADPAPPAP